MHYATPDVVVPSVSCLKLSFEFILNTKGVCCRLYVILDTERKRRNARLTPTSDISDFFSPASVSRAADDLSSHALWNVTATFSSAQDFFPFLL